MVNIAENERITPKLWQWSGVICIFFIFLSEIVGASSFAHILGISIRLLLFLVILFCFPIFRYVARKSHIKNLYGLSFVVGFWGWWLLQFVVSSFFSLGLIGGNILGVLLVSLLSAIIFAPIYMIIAVLLIKFKRQYFVEISDGQNCLTDTVEKNKKEQSAEVLSGEKEEIEDKKKTFQNNVLSCSRFSVGIPEENDKKPVFLSFGSILPEVDKDGNPILRWGMNSLWGFILGIPISLYVLKGIPCGMLLLIYLSFGVAYLLITSLIGSGVFTLVGNTLEMKSVLIKSITMGVVGYSIYYFTLYSYIYREAITAAKMGFDKQGWIFMTCAMHVAISTFFYVLLMTRGQRKKIFLIGAPVVLIFWLCWYMYP